jgi:hypothetical protein
VPDLLIKRREPTSFEVRDSVKPTIEAGQAVLALDRFGLTSNNLTYALAGNAMGYWRYFPADQGWGRMPVWGFADVIESAADGLPDGTRLFGLFPPSSYAVLQPGPSTRWGFEDVSPHRGGLPQVYNTYLRTGGDPLYSHGFEDRLAVLRILFLTAFLLVDHIQAASDSAPADTVILSSASSKTALAVAHELRQREHATVIGLTSARNEQFVRMIGAYDEVVEYGGISELSPASAVYVDFAGNADVRRQVHERLDRRLRRSVVVGASHWNRLGDDRIEHRGDDKSGGKAFALSPSQLPGPTPEFFFAGDPIARHVADSGVDGLWAMLAAPWQRFVTWTDGWLVIQHARGASGMENAYRAPLAGEIDPSVGFVITPTDEPSQR